MLLPTPVVEDPLTDPPEEVTPKEEKETEEEELRLLRSIENESLSYRFPASDTTEEDISICYRRQQNVRMANVSTQCAIMGSTKLWVGGKRHELLGNEEISQPTLGFLNPINFARTECLEASFLMGELTSRNAPLGGFVKTSQ